MILQKYPELHPNSKVYVRVNGVDYTSTKGNFIQRGDSMTVAVLNRCIALSIEAHKKEKPDELITSVEIFIGQETTET